MKIGKYTCLSTLFTGNSTTVYLGVCEDKPISFAVKVSNQNSKCHHERKMLQRFQHEGIVQLYDSFCEDSKDVIVVEHGLDFFDYININGPLSEEKAKLMFKPIFEAIQFLHSNGVVHRDIKLENIILTNNNKLKLIDFGFACNVEIVKNIFDSKGNVKNTENLFCGSNNYFPPEIMKRQCYNEKVDVWELGITLFCAVCGFFPFDSESIYSYAASAIFDDPYFGDITPSKEFSDLIFKMLEKDKNQRYSITDCLNHPFFN